MTASWTDRFFPAKPKKVTLQERATTMECPTCGAPPTANCRKLPALEREMDVSHPARVNLVRERADHRRVG